MDIPQLWLPPSDIGELLASPGAVAELAGRQAEALRVYPHFLVLKGPPPTEDRALTVRLAEAIAGIEPVWVDETGRDRAKVSFTRVRINMDKPLERRGVTRYSRTNEPLELHTDTSYSAEPHALVAFQMVRADASGGATLMAAVEDVVAALDDDTKERLRLPNFPFGRGTHPVLWEQDGTTNIRYYRRQIDTARDASDALAQDGLVAMEALDAVLMREDLLFRFHLEAGDTLFIHNTKALHGRTGFAAGSDRLMYRIRVRAGCLG